MLTEESLEKRQVLSAALRVLNLIFLLSVVFGAKKVLHYYIVMINEAGSERSMCFQEKSKNSKLIE